MMILNDMLFRFKTEMDELTLSASDNDVTPESLIELSKEKSKKKAWTKWGCFQVQQKERRIYLQCRWEWGYSWITNWVFCGMKQKAQKEGERFRINDVRDELTFNADENEETPVSPMPSSLKLNVQ